jgi:hypothetical protein
MSAQRRAGERPSGGNLEVALAPTRRLTQRVRERPISGWKLACALAIGLLPRGAHGAETSFWDEVVQWLGGVEVAWVSGQADVSASATNGAGETLTVAGGGAAQRGVTVNLYNPPAESGFTLGPALGYFAQRIRLTDFEKHVVQPPPPFGRPVDGVCSFVHSGEFVACSAVNTYILDLQSVHAGVRFGYDWVVPLTWGKLISSVGGTVQLAEYRGMTVRLGDDGLGAAEEWTAGESAELSAAFGVYVPQWHLAVRGRIAAQTYGAFAFSRRPEFMGRTTCAGDFNRCTRQRARVDETSLSSNGLSLGVAWIF